MRGFVFRRGAPRSSERCKVLGWLPLESDELWQPRKRWKSEGESWGNCIRTAQLGMMIYHKYFMNLNWKFSARYISSTEMVGFPIMYNNAYVRCFTVCWIISLLHFRRGLRCFWFAFEFSLHPVNAKQA